jgi:hypothetical protein
MNTYAETNDPLIFPVGHYCGSQYPKAGGPPKYRSLRIGRLWINLKTEDAFAVWAAAHRPTDVADEPWTRARVLDVARNRLGADEPEQAMEGFFETGVLVEVTPGTPDAVDFAKHHRVLPLMVSLGNTPEDLDAYGVGLFGLPPVITVPRLVEFFLRWSPYAQNLWEVCREYAAAKTKNGVTDPAERDPKTALDTFLRSLHTLLGPNAACIDEAQPI